MINPGFNVNKSFREQAETCMLTTFGSITQPFIKDTLSKKNTSVLELIMFYDTRADNPKKSFRVLSCVIYTIIKNYVCIDYLACQTKKLVEITVGSKGGSKHGDKVFTEYWVLELQILMNLMYCHGFLRNINYVVILKFPKRILE